MCKKVVSLLLAAVMVLTMTAFASVVYAADEDKVEADPNFKMGVILVGDETEGYSAAHIAGIKEAAAELGLDDSQIIWKYKVPEDSSCYDAAIDLVGQGCSLVIGNSYGHQTYLVQAAQEYPDITFVSMTGDFQQSAVLELQECSNITDLNIAVCIKAVWLSFSCKSTVFHNLFQLQASYNAGYITGFINVCECIQLCRGCFRLHCILPWC